MSFNSDRHQANTERTMLAVAFGLMALLGGGFAWWYLGFGPAICAITSIGGAVAVLGFLWLLMNGIERWVGRE